jgi:hypothetical protein
VDEMTIGEIARTLRRIEDLQTIHGSTLDDIKQQVTRTNGRVSMHDIEIRDIKGVFRAALALQSSIVAGVVIWWLTH